MACYQTRNRVPSCAYMMVCYQTRTSQQINPIPFGNSCPANWNGFRAKYFLAEGTEIGRQRGIERGEESRESELCNCCNN